MGKILFKFLKTTKSIDLGPLTPIEASVNQLDKDLDDIQEIQEYLRVREQRHRDSKFL